MSFHSLQQNKCCNRRWKTTSTTNELVRESWSGNMLIFHPYNTQNTFDSLNIESRQQFNNETDCWWLWNESGMTTRAKTYGGNFSFRNFTLAMLAASFQFYHVCNFLVQVNIYLEIGWFCSHSQAPHGKAFHFTHINSTHFIPTSISASPFHLLDGFWYLFYLCSWFIAFQVSQHPQNAPSTSNIWDLNLQKWENFSASTNTSFSCCWTLFSRN